MFELILSSNAKKASYNVIANKTSVNEGENITFTIVTENVKNGVVLYWQLIGTSSFNTSDFTQGIISGNVTINNNLGTITLTTNNDKLTEGNETFKFRLKESSVSPDVLFETNSITIVDTSKAPTYAINRNVSSVNEGGTVTFTVTTNNVPNGTVLYYSIGGTVTAADFTDNSLTGSVTINNNAASFSKTAKADLLTEGNETFITYLRSGSVTGTVLAQTANTTINDTSLSPTWEAWVASRGYAAHTTHSTGYKVVKVTSWTGNMWGTPYLNNYTSDSSGLRIVQHALPTQAIVDDYLLNQRSAIIYVVSAGSLSSYPSLNRNGYQSISYGTFAGSRVTEIIFWDQAKGKAYKYNPYTNSGLTIQTI